MYACGSQPSYFCQTETRPDEQRQFKNLRLSSSLYHGGLAESEQDRLRVLRTNEPKTCSSRSATEARQISGHNDEKIHERYMHLDLDTKRRALAHLRPLST